MQGSTNIKAMTGRQANIYTNNTITSLSDKTNIICDYSLMGGVSRLK